ncbi:MAG TPA: cupredoxin domain-containing protein [Candidatus Limnocylindrales bacterium]|jgi:plastocyanin
MPFLLHASAERPPRSALAVLFTGVIVLLIAACAQANAPATPVMTNQVDLPRSYRFAPENITVPTGTTVTWTNNDNFTHSVRFDGSDEVRVMKPGETVSHDFPAPGLYHYICTFHPQDMQGTVLVDPAGQIDPGSS